MHRKTLFILLAALSLALLTAAWLWQRRHPLVTVQTLQAAPLLSSLQLSARVATRSRVELGSTLTGRILAVQVRDGDAVQAGQALITLERAELDAALGQARASEALAAARLAGQRSSGRSAVQAGAAQAESVLRAAEADLQRAHSLLAQGFVSPARLDEAQRARSVAEAQLAAARAQIAANAEQGSELQQARAQLDQAQAAVQAAEAKLAQTVLAAPAAGRVLSRMAEPGQIVQPGRALLSLALNGPVELLAQADERYLGQLQPGQSAQVLADAYPGRRFGARLLRIAPLVDAQRGAVELRLAVDEPLPDFLREDMSLSLEIETGRRANALLLPLAALRGSAGGADATAASADRAEVWLLRDGRVEARQVRLGLRTLSQAEVLDGLRAGDQLVLGDGALPGQPARGRTLATAAAAPPPRTGTSADSREGAGGAISNAMGR